MGPLYPINVLAYRPGQAIWQLRFWEISMFCPLFEYILEKVLEIHVKPIQINFLSSQRSTEFTFGPFRTQNSNGCYCLIACPGLYSPHCTVWISYDFSTQILCEINFEDSRSANWAILTHLEVLNFDFYEFWHLFKAENYQMDKIYSF